MAMSPERETAPYVGFTPTPPQNEAGSLMDPPVSEPKAACAMLAPTAAAEPPDEPPATLVWSYGFFVTPYAEFSVEEPMANSSILVRPRKIAPSSRSFLMTFASKEAL